MRKTIVYFILMLIAPLFAMSYAQEKRSEKEIPVVDFDTLQPLLHKANDTTYVINFWATWCAPCVAEIPYFEELNEKYKNRKLKVLMVSLDFSTQIKSRLIPFIDRVGMKNEVIVLDDPNSNSWIPKVDADWSGAIPATLIYNKENRKFMAGEVTFEELEQAVRESLTIEEEEVEFN